MPSQRKCGIEIHSMKRNICANRKKFHDNKDEQKYVSVLITQATAQGTDIISVWYIVG
jgi:hypothetical protein